MDDRLLAFKILNRIEYDKAYSNIAIDSELNGNQTSFSSFVSALVYGVVERKITLDYFLSLYLTQPLKKLKPQVLTILRMGVYQLKFMDKIPVSAAVNESVKLTKKCGCAYSSGLVNSVLRKISADNSDYPDTDDVYYNFSIKYSCPSLLVKHFANDYGIEKTEQILSNSLGSVPIFLRVNTLKITADDLMIKLVSEGYNPQKVDGFPNSICLVNAPALHKSNCYQEGLFHVQDLASQICIETLDPKSEEVVFDMCASPGGKSFTIAEKMYNKGKIYAFDLYSHRVNLINNGAARLGIDIICGTVNDSAQCDIDLPLADRILCDVPCSGLGVIRRKPEIRYKDLGFVDKLCDLQYNIINSASRYLKTGGTLVYSTCSLNKAENQCICDKFLSVHSDFTKVELSDSDGYITLFPTKNGTDGFFIAKFIKG